MRSWLLRGLVFAFLMVLVRLVQGAMINTWETKSGMISVTLIALFACAVFVWAFIDGRADARAQPDPDRRADLAMTWLLAGLVAGVLCGAVCWVISLFYKSLYVGSLFNEITVFTAFTALLVFVAAMVGVGLGRFLVDRGNKNQPARRGGDDNNPDTDVFAAVQDDGRTQGRPAR